MQATIDSAANLIRAILQHRLLEEGQLAEMNRLAHLRFADSRALAKELLKKGLLTPYQINQLFQGRGHELIVAGYVILERLGEGSSGQVFKARHQSMKRLAAIKLIHRDHLGDEEMVRQFYREIQAVSRLSHPNVVEGFDAGPTGQTHYIAMEFVDGLDLGALVRQQGPLPVPQACDFIRQAALGLQHAYERGMVHRDIKPSNLCVSKGNIVKILDMGLARLHILPVDGRTLGTVQPSGSIVGTPDYVAPEQAEDPHKVDIRADIYSLGGTLYYLLTGQVPFPGGTLVQKLLKHQQAEPTPVEDLRRDLPAGLPAVVKRMMLKSALRRFQTPGEVASALAPYADGASQFALGLPGAGPPCNGRATGSSRPAEPFMATSSDSTICTSSVVVPQAKGWIGLVEGGWDQLRAVPDHCGKLRTMMPGSRRGRWLTAAGVGVVLMFLLWSLRPGKSVAEHEEHASLSELRGRVERREGTPAELRQELARFRRGHAGTSVGLEAAALAMTLPSPLDPLDEQRVPAEERFPWQPKELVAIYGQHQHNAPPLNLMAFSPDSRLVLSRSTDNSLYVWHLTSGEMRGTIKADVVGQVQYAALSADGSMLAVSSSDRVIRLLEVASGKVVATLPAQTVPIYRLAFSPDGFTLLTAGSDRTARLWNVPRGTERAVLTGHLQTINAVAFSPDGKTVATGGYDVTVRLWDVASGKPIRSIPVPLRAPQLVFSPDSKWLAVLSSTYQLIRVFDASTGEEQSSIKLTVRPRHLVMTPDSRGVATFASDQTIKVWDLRNGQERVSIPCPGTNLLALDFADDGHTVTTVGQDLTLKQYELASGKLRGILKGPSTWVSAMTWAPDMSSLAVGTLSGSIKLWDAAAGKSAAVRFNGHNRAIAALAFSADGANLASSSFDNTVVVWNAASGQLRATFKVPGPAEALAFTPDGKTIAISEGQTVRLWDIGTAGFKGELKHGSPVRSVAFGPTGEWLVAGTADGAVHLWSPGAGGERAVIRTKLGSASCVAPSPSGKALIAGLGSNVCRCNLSKLEQNWTGHSGNVVAVSVNGTGQAAASGGADGRVIVWQTERGNKLHEWLLPGEVNDVALADDGRHLAVLNANGTVYVLRLGTAPAAGK